MDERYLEIREYTGEGYKPIIQFGDWIVAILRWGQGLQAEQIDSMERHTQTDEVFVMLEGQATLILGGNEETVEGIFQQVMEYGKLYNVKQGVWHTVLLSRDASILIVEDRDTGNENTEDWRLTTEQRRQICEIG